jgi:hypothetical protein
MIAETPSIKPTIAKTYRSVVLSSSYLLSVRIARPAINLLLKVWQTEGLPNPHTETICRKRFRRHKTSKSHSRGSILSVPNCYKRSNHFPSAGSNGNKVP